MRTRGKLWNKEIFFSFCSRHFEYDKNCNMCQSGTWVNVWYKAFDDIIYSILPRATYKWWYKFINSG